MECIDPEKLPWMSVGDGKTWFVTFQGFFLSVSLCELSDSDTTFYLWVVTRETATRPDRVGVENTRSDAIKKGFDCIMAYFDSCPICSEIKYVRDVRCKACDFLYTMIVNAPARALKVIKKLAEDGCPIMEE